MTVPRILILSNGHGEDEMGSLLAKTLQSAGSCTVKAFPVVGEGRAYSRREIPVVGVQRVMPSGGFILEDSKSLVKDVQAGLLRLTLTQVQALRRLGTAFDWTVAVGDTYVLLLAAWFGRRPLVFVPTAKTEYIRGHYDIEYRLMRRYARVVFPRDEKTAAAMQAHQVPARYAGNLMMDAMEITGTRFGLPGGRPVIGILPGSREEAYRNLRDILAVIQRLTETGHDFNYVVGLAPSLEIARIETDLADTLWTTHRGNGTVAGVEGEITVPGARVLVVQGFFGDVLHVSDLVIGMAGTGNEQAAGLGKPVVAFAGQGAQFTPKFLEDQKRLLGESLAVVPRNPEVVAEKIVEILGNEKVRDRMAAAGHERMGEPGGLARMTREILSLVSD